MHILPMMPLLSQPGDLVSWRTQAAFLMQFAIFLKCHVLPFRALSVLVYSGPFVLPTIRHAGMGSLLHEYYAGPTIPMMPLRGLHAVVLGQFTAS